MSDRLMDNIEILLDVVTIFNNHGMCTKYIMLDLFVNGLGWTHEQYKEATQYCQAKGYIRFKFNKTDTN